MDWPPIEPDTLT
jgi:transposase